MSRHKFHAKFDDLIVVLMGPTGSGKTNFIRNATGNTKQGNTVLKSDTQYITPYTIERGDRRIVLVDTPGFDDTYRPDMEILNIIATWLTQEYASGGIFKLTGIVYLHRITDNRMPGSTYKNLQMFGQLCGDIPLPRVRLVTTMWDTARDKNVAERRETELKGDFWQPLLDGGATTLRFDNQSGSALTIIDSLLSMGDDREELLIQEELFDQRKRLKETAAAKALYSQLQQLLAEQRRTLKDLADQANARNDLASAESLREEYEKTNTQLQKTFDELKGMKVPLMRRIMLWLFGGKSRARAINLPMKDVPAL